DHVASLEPADFQAMVASVHEIESALGNGTKVPSPAEFEIAIVARKSLHWRRALAAGDRITADDVIALRPGTGLPPNQLEQVVGRSVTVATAPGTMVTPDQLGPAS